MPIDDRTAEVKRIWTATGYRRQGLSSLVMAQLEAEVARPGYTRLYLTTGNRQPEARNRYPKTGYTPLFDVTAAPETLGLLPFEKVHVPVRPYGSGRSGIRERIEGWRQRRAVARAWTQRNPIPVRLDDLPGVSTGATATTPDRVLPSPVVRPATVEPVALLPGRVLERARRTRRMKRSLI